MEAVYRDYAPRGVEFYFVYKKLAHPGMHGYVDALTLDDRLAHVREAQRTLGSSIPWLCDNMSDELRRELGGANNSEFVIDPAGKIVRMRDWSNAQTLRRDLVELAGHVETPTRAASLDLPADRSRHDYPVDVVPRVDRPTSLTRVTSTPQPSNQAFYAKLIASAEDLLLDKGDGRLLLRFELDPVHHVHWNNLAAPLEFEITQHGEGWMLPRQARAPHVAVEADLDPREFVVYCCGLDRTQPLEITVRYFACSDGEGWCRAVTQRYKVQLATPGASASGRVGRAGRAD